jgi:hypothetical protein
MGGVMRSRLLTSSDANQATQLGEFGAARLAAFQVRGFRLVLIAAAKGAFGAAGEKGVLLWLAWGQLSTSRRA